MESLLQYRILMLLPQKQVLLREETANIIFSHMMVIWTGNQYNNTAYSGVNSLANFIPWQLTISLQLQC